MSLLRWVDAVTLNIIRQRTEARKAVAWWVSNFRWHFYATLKFRYGVLKPAMFAEQKVHEEMWRWLARLQEHWPDVNVFYNLERHADGRLHVHALVGGLPRECRLEGLAQTWALDVLRRSWEVGAFHGSPYDPRRGAIDYVSKSWNDEDLISGELIGAAPMRRKKRRGHKARRRPPSRE